VDAQVISVATAVVSAAVGALGLLLTWYRREERKEEGKSHWFFIAAGVAIVVLAAVGVTFTFVLGTDVESSDASVRLTESQYKGQVTAACSDAKEKARRLEEVQPQETVFGSAIKIEQDEVGQIRELQPPDKLQGIHDDMVSVWARRISLLESTYHRLPKLSDNELRAELATADRLAEQLTELFKSLGVPECIM
jgi:hypothetical protein